MPGLLQPWWLIALGLIPLIRWLHRRQAPLSIHDVSAVFLWQDTPEVDSPGREQRPPDPAWRRRALITALLVIALSSPFAQREHAVLTVWIDESLSMLTVENGQTRLAAARQQLADELPSSGYAAGDVVTRSLSQTLPPQLDEDSAHWLVTDGASESVRDWASLMPIDRVIQTGALTENVSVSRLAARRNVVDPGQIDILVSISNTGLAQDERRDLKWDSPGGEESLADTGEGRVQRLGDFDPID